MNNNFNIYLIYALNAIWLGAGTIIITENIILSNTITISGGGSYIIQGISPSITIDCNGDRAAFTILMTKTCLIKDLTLDAAYLTTSFRGILEFIFMVISILFQEIQ